MRVLFLDIDGVLNSHDWWKRRPSRNLQLDPEAIARLSKLLADTGACVVVSSTWRLGHSLVSITRMLEANGLASEHIVRFIGATPMLNVHRGRGREIASWLAHVPVDSFAIVDDDSDMEPHMDRLVKTTCEMGLRDEHCERLRDLLTETVVR